MKFIRTVPYITPPFQRCHGYNVTFTDNCLPTFIIYCIGINVFPIVYMLACTFTVNFTSPLHKQCNIP
jgi:hypothetical protein